MPTITEAVKTRETKATYHVENEPDRPVEVSGPQDIYQWLRGGGQHLRAPYPTVKKIGSKSQTWAALVFECNESKDETFKRRRKLAAIAGVPMDTFDRHMGGWRLMG